jgi:RNA polymerase sigma factor (sigma-70 family)
MTCRSRFEAEDLAQEAMARAFERWKGVSHHPSPVGYVYSIAFNLNRSRLRKVSVQLRRALSPAARDLFEQADERLDVIRLVRALPLDQREALVLVDWVGLTSEEAGRALGIKAESVRSRVFRARQAIRARFGEEDHE